MRGGESLLALVANRLPRYPLRGDSGHVHVQVDKSGPVRQGRARLPILRPYRGYGRARTGPRYRG